jgi:hypothetical protein
MYTLMEATQWHFLPSLGGLGDQDEILMNNILTIAIRVKELKAPNA